MKDLPQPLQTWLMQSHLTPENNTHCLLFVSPHSIDLVKDLSNLSQIYSVVKSMYPDMMSLHVVSFPIKTLIENNSMSFYSVRTIKNDNSN